MRDEGYKPYNKMYKEPAPSEPEKTNDVPVMDAGQKEEAEKDISSEPKKEERKAAVVDQTKNGKVVNAAYVNLRAKPSMDNSTTQIVKVLPRDTALVILDDKVVDDFYKVKTLTGESGYIKSEYVKIR